VNKYRKWGSKLFPQPQFYQIVLLHAQIIFAACSVLKFHLSLWALEISKNKFKFSSFQIYYQIFRFIGLFHHWASVPVFGVAFLFWSTFFYNFFKTWTIFFVLTVFWCICLFSTVADMVEPRFCRQYYCCCCSCSCCCCCCCCCFPGLMVLAALALLTVLVAEKEFNLCG